MFRRFYFYILILSVLQLILPCSASGDIPDDPQQNAIALFEQGKFDQALPVFEDLLSLYPEDKKLNYYLGACLIETKDYGARARQALLNSVSKSNPEKINYYLGIAFHAENEYLAALDYYSQFEKEAKSKTKKSVDYQKLIGLCEQGINPFVAEKEEIPVVEPLQNTESVAAIGDTVVVPDAAEVVPDFIVPKKLFDSVIVFQVNQEIRYMKISQFKSEEAQMNFVKGWIKKQELDSIVLFTDNLREQYTRANSDEKQLFSGQILSNEQKVISLNREIPGYNLIARQIESKYWKNPSSEEVEKLLAQNEAITDSLELLRAGKQEKIDVLPPESVVLPIVEKTEPKEEDTEVVMKGVVYKIQIGAFSKEPPDWAQRLYKKLSLIRKISNYTDENGVTVYTTGELRSYSDAVEMQKQVKLEGIKNASVAAYNNGVRITVSEARKINGE
ncbi:MAG TPA: hypothetical protein DD458_09720 [Prolixibacteraceae bacterium]|nr:hypothetical protein [Prolixibacteraceae bacterium]HCU60599.1 hypothetical protein [Prolixibacteraceae bacterium]